MADTGDRPWNATVRERVLLAAMLFVAWGVAIEARLVYLQIYQHDALQARAENQANRRTKLEPRRGDIVDRHGRTLALSVDAATIYAVPSQIKDPAAVLEAVCWVLGDCTEKERQDYLDRLKRKKKDYASLRRKVTLQVAGLLEAQGIPAIGVQPEPKRWYPNRNLAAHVLGYLNIDNVGVSGIEQSYNSKVSGRPGSSFVEIDAKGNAFSRVERAPIPGDTLELTIDTALQHVAERELQIGVTANRAAGGSVVIMDPRTGAVLALANYPSFNPNRVGDYPEDLRRNRAVQEIYEPGSTFKVVTASAAIEEGVFKPDDLVDASAGVWRSGSRTVREAKDHNYGVLSFTDVIVKSSNVGAIKVGLSLGAERLGRYVHRFGFGSRVVFGDLPGETPGMLADPSRWGVGTIASISMGYEVGVTPVQMVAAVSAVANGGAYMQPRILKALQHGTARTEATPIELRRAIAPDTAASLVTIMEQVVEHGTGRAAQVPGYTVAGKTGTASMLVGGRYSETDYHASFIGFLPSRQPALAILVLVDAPHAGRHYGGDVAAPIFKKIAEEAMRHLRIAPTVNPAAPVLVRAAADLVEALVPASNTGGAPRVDLVTGPPTVPDVRGLAVREAVRRLATLGLVARVTGSGTVIDQDPAAGSPLAPGRACRLWVDRLTIWPPPAPPTPPQ